MCALLAALYLLVTVITSPPPLYQACVAFSEKLYHHYTEYLTLVWSGIRCALPCTYYSFVFLVAIVLRRGSCLKPRESISRSAHGRQLYRRPLLAYCMHNGIMGLCHYSVICYWKFPDSSTVYKVWPPLLQCHAAIIMYIQVSAHVSMGNEHISIYREVVITRESHGRIELCWNMYRTCIYRTCIQEKCAIGHHQRFRHFHTLPLQQRHLRTAGRHVQALKLLYLFLNNPSAWSAV